MKEKLLKTLAVLPGALIILAMVALPWVMHHVAYGRYPEQRFPFLPFTNELVKALSGTVILFELFCGCIALIALGIQLTELGTGWFGKRTAHANSRQ